MMCSTRVPPRGIHSVRINGGWDLRRPAEQLQTSKRGGMCLAILVLMWLYLSIASTPKTKSSNTSKRLKFRSLPGPHMAVKAAACQFIEEGAATSVKNVYGAWGTRTLGLSWVKTQRPTSFQKHGCNANQPPQNASDIEHCNVPRRVGMHLGIPRCTRRSGLGPGFRH